MVTPGQQFFISKVSPERDLSFELNINFMEQSNQNLWSSEVITTRFKKVFFFNVYVSLFKQLLPG